jgi:hypothetical protein
LVAAAHQPFGDEPHRQNKNPKSHNASRNGNAGADDLMRRS